MKIVLATINARYSHTSFGLRYLKANLNEYEQQTEICEFSLDESVQEIAEKIIVKNPDIFFYNFRKFRILHVLT